VARQGKEMKGFILKHNCKVEHTTQNGREN